jgi:hypothetical protein
VVARAKAVLLATKIELANCAAVADDLCACGYREDRMDGGAG